MDGLPFAFSKNPAGAGWSAVVVPSIIKDREARKILLEAQQGDDIRWGDAIYVEAHHSKLGTMDVVFRESREQHTDGEGRPFRVYEGLVLQERDKIAAFTEEHLDAAHDAMAPKLAAFWSELAWSDDQASSSLTLDLSEIQGSRPLRIVERRVHGGGRPQPSGSALKQTEPSRQPSPARQPPPVVRPRDETAIGVAKDGTKRDAPFPVGGSQTYGRSVGRNSERSSVTFLVAGAASLAVASLGPSFLRLPLRAFGFTAFAVGLATSIIRRGR